MNPEDDTKGLRAGEKKENKMGKKKNIERKEIIPYGYFLAG